MRRAILRALLTWVNCMPHTGDTAARLTGTAALQHRAAQDARDARTARDLAFQRQQARTAAMFTAMDAEDAIDAAVRDADRARRAACR